MICADVVSCFDKVIIAPLHPDSIQHVFKQGFHLLSLEQPHLCFFASTHHSAFTVEMRTSVPNNDPTCITFQLFGISLHSCCATLTCVLLTCLLPVLAGTRKDNHLAINTLFLILDVLIFLRNINCTHVRSLLRNGFTLHLKYIDDFFYGNTALAIFDLSLIYPSWVSFNVTTVRDGNLSLLGIFLNLVVIVLPDGTVIFYTNQKTHLVCPLTP
jgi:hypothetical protein